MSDSKPMFSIIIPTRNGEKYLAQTLESALHQSYPHFNLLVLESGSTDSTLEIVRAYEQRDARVILKTTSEILGIEDNWARIHQLDLNEYMTILGHDDLLHPDFLQEMVGLIQAEPRASFYHNGLQYIDAAGKTTHYSPRVPYKETGDEFLDNVHHFREHFAGGAFVARSTDYKSTGGFPNIHKLLFADALCWYRLTRLSYKVGSPQFLYAFRIHEGSTTGGSRVLDFYRAGQEYLAALAAETDYFKSPENRARASHFVAVFVRQRYRLFLHTLIKAHEPRALDDLKTIQETFDAAAARDSQLAIRTFSLRWYEWLARLSWRLARMVLFRITNVFAILAKAWSSRTKSA